jgi:hypothetical protein
MTSSTDSLIPALEMWASKSSPQLRSAGFSLKVDESRINADKASLSLVIDRKDHLGQLTIWSTGEAELECADVSTGEVRREHHDLSSTHELIVILDQLVEWLSESNLRSGRGRRFRRRRPWAM